MRRLQQGIHVSLIGCVFSVPLVMWMGAYEPFSPIKWLCLVAFVCLASALAAAEFLLSGIFPLPKTRLTLAVAIYYGYYLTLFFLFPYTNPTLFCLLSCQVMLFFLLSMTAERHTQNSLLHTLVVVALISGIYGGCQFWGVDVFHFSHGFVSRVKFGQRIYTTFGNPVLLGSFCVFILPIISAYLVGNLLEKHASRAKTSFFGHRWYLSGVFVLSLFTLFATQTRSAFVAAAFSMGIFFMLIGKTRLSVLLSRKKRLIAAGLTLVVVVCIASAFFGHFRESAFLNPAGLQERIHYFEKTLTMIREHPLIGRGLGTFAVHYPRYDDKQEVYARFGASLADKRLYHAHNEHLEQLYDGGLIGYALFLWIVAESLWRLFRRQQVLAFGMLAAFAGLLCDGLLSPSLRFLSTSFLFWLVAGCANISDFDPDTQVVQTQFPLTIRKRPKGAQTVGQTYFILHAGAGKIVLLLAIIALLIVPVGFIFQRVKAGREMKAAMYYYDRQRYRDAIGRFTQVVAHDPYQKAALYRLGNSYREVGDNDNAIAVYTQLIRIDPSFAQVNFRLAELYDAVHNENMMKYFLEQQVQVNNMTWKAYYNLATMELQAQNTATTLAYLKEIETINRIQPINPTFWQRVESTLTALLKKKS